MPTGKDICEKQLFALIDKIEKTDVDEKLIEPFLPAIYAKLSWLDREQLIKHFVSAEFNRFLNYYKNARDINVRERTSDRHNEKISYRERRKTPFVRVFVNIGSKHGLNPARLIGLINESLRSGNARIGKIEIMRNFSFFEIEKGVENTLIRAVRSEYFEGVPVSMEVAQDKPAFTPSPRKKKKKRNGGREERGDWKRKRRKRK